MNVSRPEPSAPEMADFEANTTPVHSYMAPPSHEALSTEQVAPKTTTKILVGAWDAGFFACCDYCVPNGLHAWLCPWISLAQIVSRLGMYSYAKTLLAVLAAHVITWLLVAIGYAHYLHRRQIHSDRTTEDIRDHDTGLLGFHNRADALSMPTYVSSWYFLGMFGYVVYVIGLWQLRTKVRERFQINGNRVQDCVAAGCCSPCMIAQIATHVKSYTPGSCDFGAPPDTLPPYP